MEKSAEKIEKKKPEKQAEEVFFLKDIKEKKRSEEHTSELQSHHDLVCRLLLEIGRASCRERV